MYAEVSWNVLLLFLCNKKMGSSPPMEIHDCQGVVRSESLVGDDDDSYDAAYDADVIDIWLADYDDEMPPLISDSDDEEEEYTSDTIAATFNMVVRHQAEAEAEAEVEDSPTDAAAGVYENVDRIVYLLMFYTEIGRQVRLMQNQEGGGGVGLGRADTSQA